MDCEPEDYDPTTDDHLTGDDYFGKCEDCGHLLDENGWCSWCGAEVL